MLRRTVQFPRKTDITLFNDPYPHVLRSDDCTILADIRLAIFEHEFHNITWLRCKPLIIGRQWSAKNTIRVLVNYSELKSIVLETRIGIGR